jgi:uncharacterized protein YebE (UPF0316 family)
MHHDYFSYILIPLLIFIARIIDVSLGTIRIVFISKGFKFLAPLIGFFEILIWVIAITRIMQNLDNWFNYVAYAAGFAAGNYIGMRIEEKLALGYELVRVITRKEAGELIHALRNKGYGTTQVKAHGSEGEVAVIYIIIDRKKIKNVVEIIRQFNPKALYTIEDIRFVNRKLDQWQPIVSKVKK